MKMLYLAGPWFTSEQEEEYNRVIDFLAEKYGKEYEIFIPRYYKVPNGEELENHDWGFQVYCHDRKMLDRADLVFAIDWGFTSDAGTAWEIGYAAAKGKTIVVYTPNSVGTVSCMVHGSATYTANGQVEWK